MGIKNLHKLLRKYCADAYVTQPLDAYRYKRIAVDASLYMFKYKTSAGERWMSCFVSLLAALRKTEIHPVMVFDNGAPVEKQQERAARQEARTKIQDKAIALEDAINTYNLTGEVTDYLREINKNCIATKEKKLLKPVKTTTVIDIKILEYELRKLQNQSISVSGEDFKLLRELCSIMNVPIIEAPDEAEKKCSELCIAGAVYGVMTEDTDVLAYGVPIYLSDVKYHDSQCVELALEDILDGLELTYEQFRDLCIMCGTDYNKNIYKIGPEKAYALIKQHGSIDEIAKNTTLDVSVLNHARSRELLTAVPDDQEIPYCKVPDFKRLDIFLFKNNSKVNIDGLKKCFEQHTLEFDD